nr:hypothetical protein [Tanacetum cinerariifolium]
LLQEAQWAYLSTHPSKRLLSFCFDDDEEDYTSAITPDEPVLSTEEPDNSLTTESDQFIKSGVETLIPIPSESEGIPEHMCDVPSHDNSPPLDVSKDQIEDFSESNNEFSSIDDDSFSIDDIDYVEASPPDFELVSSEVMEIVIPESLKYIPDDVQWTEQSSLGCSFVPFLSPLINSTAQKHYTIEASPPDSELVSSEVMEIVIPDVGGIDDDILLTIKDDILREKLLNTKSSSTSLNSLLEETNTFDNSLPEFETFYFDVEEISSGSTTTPPDISLPKYEVFHDDHVKEISSGSPTTHSDYSIYASFIFDLSINPFPPADMSDSYEFTDELIPFISAPEYDCLLFKVEPNLRDFTKDVVEDISPTKKPQVLNALPTHPTLQLNMMFQPSSESLFAYVYSQIYEDSRQWISIFQVFIISSV